MEENEDGLWAGWEKERWWKSGVKGRGWSRGWVRSIMERKIGKRVIKKLGSFEIVVPYRSS